MEKFIKLLEYSLIGCIGGLVCAFLSCLVIGYQSTFPYFYFGFQGVLFGVLYFLLELALLRELGKPAAYIIGAIAGFLSAIPYSLISFRSSWAAGIPVDVMVGVVKSVLIYILESGIAGLFLSFCILKLARRGQVKAPPQK